MNVLFLIPLAILTGFGGVLLISGDGVLLIFEKLLGVSELKLDFLGLAVILHLGNLLAVLLFYWRDVLRLSGELLKLLHIVKTPPAERRRQTVSRRELWMLLIALLPLLGALALIGPVRSLYQSENVLLAVGVLLIVNGLVLFFSERLYRGHRNEFSMRPLDALLIGLAQTVSVFPGLSRTGLTVGVGVACGLKRDYAVRFSSLLSIPAYLAALAAVLILGGGAMLPEWWVCLAGVALSTLASYGALRMRQRFFAYGRSDFFSYWCWGAGILSVVLVLIT